MTIRTISIKWEEANKSFAGVTNYAIHIFQTVLGYGYCSADLTSNYDWELFYSGSTVTSHIMCQLSYEQHGALWEFSVLPEKSHYMCYLFLQQFCHTKGAIKCFWVGSDVGRSAGFSFIIKGLQSYWVWRCFATDKTPKWYIKHEENDGWMCGGRPASVSGVVCGRWLALTCVGSRSVP